ncbi:palmitoyltransferase AKR1-like [Portunus trituberculatus]|uniref:palmitoyltransferase AKR1-like n=1 Tax=Portunus trituberculatus TaxID=210409 RepID=UPI001E1D0BA5|nr:palmitoyltransferase AKR1-like [Portunus trituberculatus]XP_045111871.1 palmitoyltransferase AKR1-like [Portunus trituberculatus]
MDSGIDSTESSNGSAEEVEGAMEAAPLVEPLSPPHHKNAVALSSSSSSLSPSSSPSSSSSLPTARPNTPSSSSSSTTTALLPTVSAPSSLRVLAASTVNEIQTEVLENGKNQSEPIQGGSQVVMKTPPNTPAHTTFKLGNTEINENSHLQLHFPLPSRGPTEDSRENTFDLDPPPGLTFANVSPSMCLSHGYEVYSQGYAVLPYEHNVLKKKLRTLRLRMRQHHYKILCAKSKQRKLRIAVGLNNVASVEQLLKEGVDPRVTDNKERSPLHIAASKGYAEIARLLLQHGADPNQKDAIGNTALHLAACTSNIPMVTLLLKSGTNVRQADNQGYSPLHLARSKLKLLQRDNSSSSCEIKKQVYQVIEMMQTFLECSGSSEEAELLSCFTNQLSLSDTRQDVQALLDSLNNLSLTSNSTTTNASTTNTITTSSAASTTS